MKQSAHKMEGGVGRCLRGVGGRRQSTEARGEDGTCPTCDEPLCGCHERHLYRAFVRLPLCDMCDERLSVDLDIFRSQQQLTAVTMEDPVSAVVV